MITRMLYWANVYQIAKQDDLDFLSYFYTCHGCCVVGETIAFTSLS